MKDKVHYIIEAALAAAIVVLFVINSKVHNNSDNIPPARVETLNSETKPMPMAYVDVDSLMANYTYAIDLQEQIAKKVENLKATLTERTRKLEAEFAEYQRKMETQAFLSRERQEAEQNRIIKQRDQLQKFEQESTQELAVEQGRIHEELRSTIISQIRLFNKEKGFQLIYGKAYDNILYADDVFNITADVIKFLNRQHQQSPIAKPQ
jgi:outer membrane protein